MFLFLCLLFLIPTTLAADKEKGIFYILDEKFIDNINELPYYAGNPDKQIQTSGHIEAWIDIVGFKQMIHENGFDYIPGSGNPADYAIIQYDANGTHWGITRSIEKTVSVQQSGNNVTASLQVVLKWYTVVCDKWGCWPVHRTETATFQDTEIAPQKYPELKEGLKAKITQYNNSLYENIGISIVNISGLNKYTIQYKDNIATCRMKKAHVEQTAKGVYFANVTPVEFLELKGKNISRYGNMILLNGNLSKMSLDDIRITGSNLYETKSVDSSQFNITRLEFKPEKELKNPVMMWFLSLIAVTAGGIYYYARRMTQLWLRNM
ncbi:MAG TPA: hypothetical protein VN368_02200 [Candidatus Methylomirabilis sp.]|nr:hypothetical protein [Candidatus Methylomirabilis sp.]